MNYEIYEEKESFILYSSFYHLHFADLTNEEKGILIDCIFQYTLTGQTDFEVFERDRGLKVSFRSMIDVIDRNNVKWAESKERRSNGNKKAWAKRKLGDSRTIEMPDNSLLVMKGNLANMPTSYDEYKHRTGITNYEELRTFNNFCNHHNWCVSLEEMKQEYDAS